MIRKLLIACLVGVAPLFADQVAISKFGMLNNNSPSVSIPNESAQDLLNVDVTPAGLSVKKRSGYGVYKALATGQPMHGGYHAFDSSGNDYQLWGSSTSLYSIVADATPVQIISSATLNSTWDCADTQGNSYCVDSNRDLYLRTNGTTKTWFSSPLGTMIESTPDRVVVAGVSGSPNTLFVSQSNTFTNFTVGVNATDAFTEVIGSPGSRITHIRWGCAKLLWWKDASFGYFDFDDQFTGQVKTVSDVIGTFDNTSAIDPGGRVWFRGQDGHTWMYDCSVLNKQSIDITPNIQTSGKRTANSWTQTTQSDFQNGASTPTASLSFTSSPGDVVLSTSIVLISSPSFEAGPDNVPDSITGWGITHTGNSPVAKVLRTSSTFCGANVNSFAGSYYFSLRQAVVGQITPSVDLVDASSNVITTFGLGTSGVCSWTNGYIVNSSSVGATVMIRINGQTSSNGGTQTISNKFTWPGAVQFWYVVDNDASGNVAIDNFITSASSASFYSAIHNSPNLTTWSTLGINAILNNGTETYYLRSSTNTFTTFSSTPSWTTQTAGNLISISTGTFFQFRDDFVITAPTQTPTLNDFTINWFEGNASDQAYMLYFDNAIWESVAFGAGQAINNYIFKYDLINDGFTLYNFGAGGILSTANTLYFGDTAAGNVFNYGSATADNGVAINSYWRSRSFTGQDPFLQNQLTNIDFFAKKNQGTTLTGTYTIENSTATSYSISLSTTTQAFMQNRKLLPSGKMGYTFDYKFGDTSASSAWEVLGVRIGFAQQPYRPTQ